MPTIDNWRALRDAISADSAEWLTSNLEMLAALIGDPRPRATVRDAIAYIRAASPATLRSLLDERDRLAAEVEALRADAGRYRWLRAWTRGIRSTDNYPAFQFPSVQIPAGLNIMRGSVAQHLDAVIDAAMKGKP